MIMFSFFRMRLRGQTTPVRQRLPFAEFTVRTPSCSSLEGVIAVVGCDGSGKSTLTTDLVARLREERPAELLYLGQDSGNILRWVSDIPLVGGTIGRYLLRKSKRAHAEKDRPASPDTLMALVIYVLSRWRRRKFQKMLALDRRGTTVITDRYPQAEAPGFYFDGPGLIATDSSSRLVRWIAARELRLYRDMASHVPKLLIRLNLDAETAHARKPDHNLSMLRDKVRVIPTLTFGGAPILDIDAANLYPQVLDVALAAALKALK